MVTKIGKFKGRNGLQRLILVLSLVCALPISAAAQIAFVQRNQDANDSGTITLDGVAAGSLLTLCVSIPTAGVTLTGVTDDRGNTWAPGPTATNGRPAYLWYAANVAAGDTLVTAAVSGTPEGFHTILAEFSGLATVSPQDQTATGTGSSAAPATSATSTTTQANELLVGCIGSGVGATFVQGTNYNLLDEFTGQRIHGEYRIVSSAGTYVADGTFSTGSDTWAAMVGTYKAPGGATTVKRLLLLGVGDKQQ